MLDHIDAAILDPTTSHVILANTEVLTLVKIGRLHVQRQRDAQHLAETRTAVLELQRAEPRDEPLES